MDIVRSQLRIIILIGFQSCPLFSRSVFVYFFLCERSVDYVAAHFSIFCGGLSSVLVFKLKVLHHTRKMATFSGILFVFSFFLFAAVSVCVCLVFFFNFLISLNILFIILFHVILRYFASLRHIEVSFK